MGKKLTTEEFIDHARKVHGNKYDYSQVEYANAGTKVDIICPKHGIFRQTPSSHLQNHGCPECSKREISRKKTYTTEEFIQKTRAKHGNKYDYSKVEYVNNKTKVKIICPIHGEFEQTPNSHLSGKGCIFCSGKAKKTTEQFIVEARKTHGDKYDYSQAKYINAHTKVCIICPVHGSFEIRPDSHICLKRGCERCARIQGVETKKKNGTLNTSQPEENLYKLLCDKFGVDDVIRQYRDNQRYPYSCDFYVKSLDLFIELNASQYHNGHFFDENNKDDLEQLKVFQEKASKSEYNQYHEIIQTWTKRDLLKKKTAIQNNLNYKVFWDNDLTDALTWLNSI